MSRDYEPVDELPQILEKGIVELKNRLEAEERGLGKGPNRMFALKGKSKKFEQLLGCNAHYAILVQ
jgi:hypothetical protein